MHVTEELKLKQPQRQHQLLKKNEASIAYSLASMSLCVVRITLIEYEMENNTFEMKKKRKKMWQTMVLVLTRAKLSVWKEEKWKSRKRFEEKESQVTDFFSVLCAFGNRKKKKRKNEKVKVFLVWRMCISIWYTKTLNWFAWRPLKCDVPCELTESSLHSSKTKNEMEFLSHLMTKRAANQ